ncbi:MAG: AmmeMemoRadiSam system protein B [Candidatus Accumulibacter necessarius]|jgi:AmmeMemoRadiSam system protein B|uniref:AmmeMemoRadiSam system protein B n=1 Tax=Candidatus Accumulibacter necessarius TaxID=2954386 RepID=UPI002FC33DA6
MSYSTPHIRPAAVAGMFYPASPGGLIRDLQQMLDRAPSLQRGATEGDHCPPCRLRLFGTDRRQRLCTARFPARQSIRRVVLLGPTHRVAVDGLAVPSAAAFATPLGDIPIDQEAIAAIDHLPQVVVSDAAHALEHSLEVQLPFLQTVLAEFTLVPLAVGRASAAQVAEVLECLWGGDETLIVISSDLSHYLPYALARETDSNTARHIVALEPHIDHQQACGATPVNGLLLAARRHGLKAELVDLRNSGDTAGDRSRVVGYGAFTFSAEPEHVH